MPTKESTNAEQERIIADRDRTIAESMRIITEHERTIAQHKRTIAEQRQTIIENVDALANQANAIKLKDALYLRADTTLQALFQLMTDLVVLKDPYTKGHSERTSTLALLIAENADIQFPSDKLVTLRHAAMLHDIGKIAISDPILNKATLLTEIERLVLEQHPFVGYRLVAQLDIDPMIRDVILSHHENFDGTGYPGHLKGEEIPLAARILRIADVYEALTSRRPYRAALGRDQALETITQTRQYFDPRLPDVLAGVLSRYHEQPE